MSTKYLCLNCWRTPTLEETYYRCPQCGSGGGADLADWLKRRSVGSLSRVSDLRVSWSKHLISGEPQKPRCPQHPKANLSFYCPCQAYLPPSSVLTNAPWGLGIAGPRSSGKTLLTITMVNELRGLQVDNGKRLALEGVGKTEERFHKLSDQFLNGGARPSATDPPAKDEALEADEERNFCWNLYVAESDGRPKAAAILPIYDVAGETWGMPSDESLARFDRYMGLVRSLVFLIDGAAVAADLDYTERDAWARVKLSRQSGWSDRQWLTRVQERLGERAGQVDIALVLSKADYFWDRPEWMDLRQGTPEERFRPSLEQLLRQSKRLDLLVTARAHFRRVELFSLSSLGFHPGPNDVQQERLVRLPEPKNVTGPFAWLLKNRFAGPR